MQNVLTKIFTTDISKIKFLICQKFYFQISPLVLLSLKDSKIDSIQDFVDQRIMIVKDSSMSAEIQSMILDNGISLKDMRVIPHSFLF
jgi:hypothetical protein